MTVVSALSAYRFFHRLRLRAAQVVARVIVLRVSFALRVVANRSAGVGGSRRFRVASRHTSARCRKRSRCGSPGAILMRHNPACASRPHGRAKIKRGRQIRTRAGSENRGRDSGPNKRRTFRHGLTFARERTVRMLMPKVCVSLCVGLVAAALSRTRAITANEWKWATH